MSYCIDIDIDSSQEIFERWQTYRGLLTSRDPAAKVLGSGFWESVRENCKLSQNQHLPLLDVQETDNEFGGLGGDSSNLSKQVHHETLDGERKIDFLRLRFSDADTKAEAWTSEEIHDLLKAVAHTLSRMVGSWQLCFSVYAVVDVSSHNDTYGPFVLHTAKKIINLAAKRNLPQSVDTIKVQKKQKQAAMKAQRINK
jgi:hypothetical protein